MLDISEITYFQCKKKIVWLSQHLTIIYASVFWSFGPVCLLARFDITVRFTRDASAPTDTHPGTLINYNDINSSTTRNH